MRKKIINLLVCLAAVFGLSTATIVKDVTPASAWLSGCSVGWYSTNDGHASCTTPHFGGLNLVRVVLLCWAVNGQSTETKYGSYVRANILSAAWCDSSHPNGGAVTYQLL